MRPCGGAMVDSVFCAVPLILWAYRKGLARITFWGATFLTAMILCIAAYYVSVVTQTISILRRAAGGASLRSSSNMVIAIQTTLCGILNNMSAVAKVISEIYSAENKRGSVWAKTPLQTLIDRIPGLLSNETVLRVRRQSIAVIIGPLIRCARSILCYGLLAIASPVPFLSRICFIAMLAWVLYLAVVTWGWNFTLIAVTDRRVIIREGWLTRLVKPVPLRQITSTTVRQRQEWQTLLDVGDVTLEVLAENDPKFTLLEEPYEFRRLLQYTKDAVDDWLYKKRKTETSDWLGDYLMPGEAGG